MALRKQTTGPDGAGAGMAGAGVGTAGNIQGNLHLPGYDWPKKKRKIRKDAVDDLEQPDYATLYVSRHVVNAATIVDWAKAQGVATTLAPEDLHVTVAYSKQPVDWTSLDDDAARLVVPAAEDPADARSVARFGDAVVLRFESPELTERWLDFVNHGATWDHAGYHPHITISWDAPDLDLSTIVAYRGAIILGPEVFAPIVENWQDSIVEKSDEQAMSEPAIDKRGARHSKSDRDMIQAMHDHAVSLGAQCDGDNLSEEEDNARKRFFKTDNELGIVFGYAIVCKVNGAPYYDLNVDLTTGKKVPEYIPEDAMLKAAADFMATHRPGNEMHIGPDKGTYLFAWPMTTEIAKAMGIQTNITGLLVAFKPPEDLLEKFKDGTYKGFSIEGRRLRVREIED